MYEEEQQMFITEINAFFKPKLITRLPEATGCFFEIGVSLSVSSAVIHRVHKQTTQVQLFTEFIKNHTAALIHVLYIEPHRSCYSQRS